MLSAVYLFLVSLLACTFPFCCWAQLSLHVPHERKITWFSTAGWENTGTQLICTFLIECSLTPQSAPSLPNAFRSKPRDALSVPQCCPLQNGYSGHPDTKVTSPPQQKRVSRQLSTFQHCPVSCRKHNAFPGKSVRLFKGNSKSPSMLGIKSIFEARDEKYI